MLTVLNYFNYLDRQVVYGMTDKIGESFNLMTDQLQHYIGGAHVDSVDGAVFEVLDPVSNETYLHAAAGKAADVDRAVTAARHAFEDGPWPRMLPRERSRVLHRVADLVESRDARLAELESFDSGG